MMTDARTLALALLVAGGLAACSANLASGPPNDSGPLASRDEAPAVAAAATVPPAAAMTATAASPAKAPARARAETRRAATPGSGSAPAQAAAPAETAAETAAPPPSAVDVRPQRPTVADLAKANAESPGDAVLAMAYVRALKSGGKRAEALAVLDAAAEASPADHTLRVEQGLLALELGQAGKAQGALQKAAERGPDWRVLSGLGIAASSQGQQQEAQRHFARALELSPNNPVVLNNLAMSLLLDRKPAEAETLLRRAARGAGQRHQVTHNLALAQQLKTEATE